MTIDTNELVRIRDELSHHDPDSSDPMIRNGHALLREIDRLNAELDGVAGAAGWIEGENARLRTEIERLRALLTEAREHLRTWAGIFGFPVLREMVARIDAALDGGAPCATCNAEHVDEFGVSRVLAGSVDIGGGVLSSFEACPDCGGSGVAS